MVRFNKEWFNPLYFILNDLIKDDTIRTIWVYGGKSSAKTVTIAQVLAKEAYLSNANSIAFRKEGTTVKTTLKKSFKLAIKTTRLFPVFNTLDFMFKTTKGSEIVLKGLDTEEKAKGIESYKYVYLDELNHFSEEEYTQFNLSLRGMPGQKILASWNPVSETSWVKVNLIDSYTFVETAYKLPCATSFVKRSTCGSVVLIKTTFEDNYWIAGTKDNSYGFRDNNLIAVYEKLKTTDFNSYRVNVLGEWGVMKTGGEFWPSFDVAKHVKKSSIAQTTIHVSLDDNNDPYVTQTIWQIFPTVKKICQKSEILSKAPNNNAPKAAKQFAEWLLSINYKDTLFIYGDPSAGARSTIDPNNASFYDKYIDVLRGYGFSIVKRVGRSAPEVSLSGDFINAIYESNYGGWTIEISDTCLVSINDYSVVKKDADGKMFKPKVKNKETGITYEPNGHISDSKRYLITTLLAAEWNTFKARGKRSGSIAV